MTAEFDHALVSVSVREATHLGASFICVENSSVRFGQSLEKSSQVVRPNRSAPVCRRAPSLNLSPATASGPYR